LLGAAALLSASSSVKLSRLNEASAHTLRLSTVETLGLSVLEFLDLSLVLLDHLFVGSSFLDAGVRVFLLSLASDTLSFHDVPIDAPRDFTVHTLHLLQLGGLEVFLGSKFAGGLFFPPARLLLALLLDLGQLLLVNFLFLLRFLDELLETLCEFGSSSVSLGRLNCRVFVLLPSALDDALDGGEVLIKSLQLVLHLLEVAVLQSLLLFLGHGHSFECLHLLAFKSIRETGSFALLGNSTHEDLFRSICHFAL